MRMLKLFALLITVGGQLGDRRSPCLPGVLGAAAGTDLMYATAWEFARYPTDVYRRPMRFVLTYVFPMALVATLPSATLMRGPSGNGLLAKVATGAGAVLLAVGVWSRGVRRYTGATS